MNDGSTEFETERGRLHSLAYRMLGSVADADDAVQDAWLRWHRLGEDGRAAVDRPSAWLTTVVSRLALDRLKSARADQRSARTQGRLNSCAREVISAFERAKPCPL